MERIIYWHTLGRRADDTEFTAAAMNQFLARLRQELPGMNLRVSELPTDLRDQILSHLAIGYLEGAAREIQDAWGAKHPALLFHVSVYCPDEAHPAVRAARRRLAHAAWGISLNGVLA
jgi:hypothetical protein